MKRLFALMFFLSSLTLFAQYKDVGVNQYKVVGKAYSTNIDVLAKITEFNDNIYSVSSNDGSNAVLITLWKGAPEVSLSQIQYKAKQVYYDLNEHKALWTKKANMLGNYVFPIGKYLYAPKRKNICLVDFETGKKDFVIGKIKQMVWSDSKAGWLVCLDESDGWTWKSSLRKIDLKGKQVVWERDASSIYSWSYLGSLSDTKALFVGEGLHCVNFDDGSGWDYAITTNETFVLLSSYERPQEDHFSNIIVAEDSSSFYFAGMDKVVNLTADGAKIWETEIEKKYKMGYSMLIDDQKNQSILLVNKGFTECEVGFVYDSKPFFAIIDKNTGEIRRFHEMDSKNEKIVDAKTCGNELFLLVYNTKEKSRCFVKYNIDNFDLLAKKSLSDIGEELSFHLGFVDSGLFERQGDSLVPFCVDSTGLYALEQLGVVYFNRKFDNGKLITMDKLYLYKGESEGLRFYGNQGAIYLTDGDNKLVGELYFSDFSETESSMIFNQGERLYEISKEQLRALMEKDQPKMHETEVIDEKQ